MDRKNLNDHWKTVVDTIQDGVMIVDPEGKIISVNRGFEEINGFTRREGMINTEHLPLNISENIETRADPIAKPADLDKIKKEQLIQALEASDGN